MSSLKLNQLRQLISEEIKKGLLEVGEKDKKEEGEDSLDAQVDKYLLSYEKESKSSKNEGKDFRMLVKRFLKEAEEDEESKDKEGKEGEEKKLTSDDIDIENFSRSVMRFIDNYDALLDVRNTVLRRAVNFLIEGYESDVSQAFKESIMDEYGIQIGKTKSDVEDDEYQSPAADRAGASPGGA
jgi:hypothetical protein